MVRRVLPFAGAVILCLSGAGSVCLLVTEESPLGFAIFAGFFCLIGAGWLWIDFIAPRFGYRPKDY
jgi:hypothetical protein